MERKKTDNCCEKQVATTCQSIKEHNVTNILQSVLLNQEKVSTMLTSATQLLFMIIDFQIFFSVFVFFLHEQK